MITNTATNTALNEAAHGGVVAGRALAGPITSASRSRNEIPQPASAATKPMATFCPRTMTAIDVLVAPMTWSKPRSRRRLARRVLVVDEIKMAEATNANNPNPATTVPSNPFTNVTNLRSSLAVVATRISRP